MSAPPLKPELEKLVVKARQAGYPNTRLQFITSKQDLTNCFSTDGASLYVVVVYADWCGACHVVTPNLIKLQALDEFKSMCNKVVIAMIEESSLESVWKNAPIRGFPTIFLFRDSRMTPAPHGVDKTGSLKVQHPQAILEVLKVNLGQLNPVETKKIDTSTMTASTSSKLEVRYDAKGKYRPVTEYGLNLVTELQKKGYDIQLNAIEGLQVSPQVVYEGQILYGPDAIQFLTRLANPEL